MGEADDNAAGEIPLAPVDGSGGDRIEGLDLEGSLGPVGDDLRDESGNVSEDAIAAMMSEDLDKEKLPASTNLDGLLADQDSLYDSLMGSKGFKRYDTNPDAYDKNQDNIRRLYVNDNMAICFRDGHFDVMFAYSLAGHVPKLSDMQNGPDREQLVDMLKDMSSEVKKTALKDDDRRSLPSPYDSAGSVISFAYKSRLTWEGTPTEEGLGKIIDIANEIDGKIKAVIAKHMTNYMAEGKSFDSGAIKNAAGANAYDLQLRHYKHSSD